MDNEHQAAIATIPCKVSLGMFSTERGVRIELPDGRKIAALVDKHHVVVKEEPQSNTEVDGRLAVFVVEYLDDSVLVDLPQPSMTEGTRLRIPRSMLEVNGQ
jgi:hypothetical protein